MKRKRERHTFQVGDKVKLVRDVLQHHARSVPAHMGYTREQFAWRRTLDALEGKTGTISRVFEGSNHVNVDFDGEVIGIGASELVQVNAYGGKRDYHKIEIFVDGVYVATTAWAKSLKEAKERFIQEHPRFKGATITAAYAPKRR